MPSREGTDLSAGRGRVVAVIGPTAVGKTAVAVRLAQSFEGEIVSLDSRQIYRRLDIGTAKPTAEERRRAHHHLLDVTDPDEPLTLAQVQELAYEAIESILARRHLPILAGGTGQYVAAVLEGWQIPRVAPDHALRDHLVAEANRHGPEALHARLAAVDPVAAERIAPRNVRRVVRALEVFAHTGRPISELQSRQAPPYEVLRIGLSLPRSELYERIDRRIDAMIDAGLEEEVRRLLDDGYGFDLPAMSGLGYGEWRAFFDSDEAVDRKAVVQSIRRNTRRLVRSQATWFRPGDTRITWFDLSLSSYDDVADCVRHFLAADGP